MKSWKMQFNVAGSTDKMECFDFEMIIDNVSQLDVAKSLPLTTTRICITTWQVVVEVEMVTKQMRVGLKRTDSSVCNIKANMFFEIQNERNEVYWRDSIQQVYNSNYIKCCYADYLDIPNCQHSLPRINGGKLFKLSTDKIIIKGNVLLKEQYISLNHKRITHVLLNEALGDLKCDYKNLYYNPKFSDITFRFASGNLYAHKNILSSRSSVFQKTFEKNYSQNEIDITDVDKSVFDMFLLFLYCGAVEIENKDLVSLYVLAGEYEVHKLSRICSNLLALDITVKTVTRTLELANTHEDTVLKEAAIDFVCKKFLEVSQTDNWNSLLSSNPCLASVVLKRVSESFKKCKSVPIVTVN